MLTLSIKYSHRGKDSIKHMAQEYPLRPNVCLILLNSKGKLLLAERAGEPGVWQFPQGGVEPGGSEEESVLRELQEELGVPKRSLTILRRLSARHSYEFQKPKKYGNRLWRGQEQSFWLVLFTGDDSQIDLEQDEQELMDYSWCSVQEVLERAQPKRLVGYRKVLPEVEVFLRESFPQLSKLNSRATGSR